MNLPPLIRANGKMFNRSSCAVRLNGTVRITEIDSIEWSDEVPAELIPSGADNAPPLGVALGNYACSASISIYADAAARFEDDVLRLDLTDRLPIPGVSLTEKNLTSELFQLSIIMREEMRSRVVHLMNCIIVGRPSRTVGADGNALVKQYQLQPRLIVEDGKTLVDRNRL